MSFPGTYNIRYYKGDTLEFRVFPKAANGEAFPLNEFSSIKFSIAESRGASTIIPGYAAVSEDGKSIVCAITPAISASLLMNKSPYVYDVEIGKDATPDDCVYTLLTGTISLTDQVTPFTDIVPPEPPLSIPSAPTVGVLNVTETTVTLGWVQDEDDTVDTYDVYITPNPLNPALLFTDEIDGTEQTYTFTGLMTGITYYYSVVATNTAGSSAFDASSASGTVVPADGES
jgi:hypothetical protein